MAKLTATLDPAVNAEFDEYADDYETALNRGISVSGENKDYFAENRIKFLGKLLKSKMVPASPRVLDFGCGTGSSTPYFLDLLSAKHVVGVDVSESSLNVARKTYDPNRSEFATLENYVPNASLDLAFCNGVFHHIPLAERRSCVQYVYRALNPGGYFAFWENNPWNPGTRYVMSRIPFDKDAITLTPPTAHKLLREGGFEIIQTNFLFIFPRALAPLRALEPFLATLPLGAQYLVLCQKMP